jgi:hypothetical protein
MVVLCDTARIRVCLLEDSSYDSVLNRRLSHPNVRKLFVLSKESLEDPGFAQLHRSGVANALFRKQKTPYWGRYRTSEEAQALGARREMKRRKSCSRIY